LLLYPGVICGCVAGKNRNSSESETKVSLHSIPENLLVMEVEMLVQYGEQESCSVSLKIFSAFSRLSVYLQKRSTVLLEITEEGFENDTVPVKVSFCAFVLTCTKGISNFLPRCVL